MQTHNTHIGRDSLWTSKENFREIMHIFSVTVRLFACVIYLALL